MSRPRRKLRSMENTILVQTSETGVKAIEEIQDSHNLKCVVEKSKLGYYVEITGDTFNNVIHSLMYLTRNYNCPFVFKGIMA